MRMQSRDTQIEAVDVLLGLLWSKSPAEKLGQVRSLSQPIIGLPRRAIARANCGKDPVKLDLLFIRLHYAESLARKVVAYIGEGRE